MASSSSHHPIKGILKNNSSLTSSMEGSAHFSGRPGTQELQRKKSQKWAESKNLEIHYPFYKDYDLMKMNEPSNPCVTVPHDGEDTKSEVQRKETMTPDVLARRFLASNIFGFRGEDEEQDSSGAHTSKFFLDKLERQRQFKLKRKLHYNEGLNIKLARQLISEEEELQSDIEEDEKHLRLQSNH